MNTALTATVVLCPLCVQQSFTVKDFITLKKAADNDDNPNSGIDDNNEA